MFWMNSACTPLGARSRVCVMGVAAPGPCALLSDPSSISTQQPAERSSGFTMSTSAAARPAAAPEQQLGVRVYDGPTACSTEETVMPGKRLGMHYTGTIDASSKTGTPKMTFDSSRSRGQVFRFTVGAHEVIQGWDTGLLGLCKGAKAILVIPPSLGYGAQGIGPIPGGATLNFDVEVVTVEGQGRTPSGYGAPPPLTSVPPLLAPTRSPPPPLLATADGGWDFLPDALNGTLSRVLAAEVGVSIIGILALCALLVVCSITVRVLRRSAAGYSGVSISNELAIPSDGSAALRVCFVLESGMREEGLVSLSGIRSVQQLRISLLQLADDLLLDPEDDLGEWTLRFTDVDGTLQAVTPAVSMDQLRKRAQELRVTAGPPLRRSPRSRA